MDPRLHQMIEGDAGDEVEAIIRLEKNAEPPPHVRLIARFGEVATCRMPRGRIASIWADNTVTSLKAPLVFGIEPDPMPVEAADNDEAATGGDQRRPSNLRETGHGVVVGVIDWGFDFAHLNFRHGDGTTRALALWDQTAPGPSPEPYGYGHVYRRADIDRALRDSDPYAALGYHPASGDPTGGGSHGTHVHDIAAGAGRARGAPMGIAPGAELLFCHLATRDTEGRANLGDSVTLLEALDWMGREAEDRPCVVNLSVGRHGGPHHGRTLVEQGIDNWVAQQSGRAVVQSAGNYYEARTHASGTLRPGQVRGLSWWTERADVTPNELEIWYPGGDVFGVRFESPDGSTVDVPLGDDDDVRAGGNAVGRIYHRARDPAAGDNHINIFLYHTAPPGRWRVVLSGEDVVDGRWHAWVERDAACASCQSRLDPADADPHSTTGTIANGFRAIAVGAYDAHRHDRPLGRFSSCGPTRDGRVKPDICAPGVRILAARSRSRELGAETPLLFRQSGTSMAAPHVTGACALVFEAAGRPLTIQETRRVLLGSADPPPPGAEPYRWGSGILNVEAAVAAARRAGSNAIHEVDEDAELIAAGVTDDWTPRFLEEAVMEDTVQRGERRGKRCRCEELEMDRVSEFAASGMEAYHDVGVAQLLAGAELAGVGTVGGRATPATLFDSIVASPRAQSQLQRVAEVVGLPGQRPVKQPQPGDVVVVRPLGHGGLATAEVISERENRLAEGRPAEPGGRSREKRPWSPPNQIVDESGRLPLDSMVLRPIRVSETLRGIETDRAIVTFEEEPEFAESISMPIDTAIIWNNGKAYFLKGDEYTRYDIKADRVDPGYPKKIKPNWPGLEWRDIDAAVMWPNGKAYLTRGDEYVAYDVKTDRVLPGYPKKIAGNWPGLTWRDIDTMILWPNNKVYIFKGDEYVRYDVKTDKVDPGYPLKIAPNWPGLSWHDIDAALMWPSGNAYFFKGDEYVKYEVKANRVAPGYPKRIAGNWPGLVKGTAAATCTCTEGRKYAFGYKTVSDVCGVRAKITTRYGKVCCEGEKTVSAYQVAYANISASGSPLHWGQTGWGRERNPGASTQVRYRYAEVNGTTYYVDYDTSHAPVDASVHKYQATVDKATGKWTFRQNGTAWKNFTDAAWKKLGATIQYTGEIRNSEDDMPGTDSKRCVFSECQRLKDGASWADAGLVAGDVRSDDNSEWGAKHLSATSLEIWDKKPLP